MKATFYVFDGLDPQEITVHLDERAARDDAERRSLRGRVAVVTRLVSRYEPASRVLEVE